MTAGKGRIAAALSPVIVRTDRATLALWQEAIGLAPEELAWVQLGGAAVLEGEEIAVTVVVPEAHRAYLAVTLGSAAIGAALGKEITRSAALVVRRVEAEKAFLALPERAEESLPKGNVVVSWTVQDLADIQGVIAEAAGPVGRIALWRLGPAVGGIARIGVLLPDELLDRMMAAYTVEERQQDLGGVVAMVIVQALRDEEQGSTRGEQAAIMPQ